MSSASSNFATPQRRSPRKPRQERATRRVASILDAATGLIATAGYEATTMTGIARRAGASVGALYDYFPDKVSIAFAILNGYAKELEARWTPSIRDAAKLTPEQFANLLIEAMHEFIEERPAFVPLTNASFRFVRNPDARSATRNAFANAFCAINPKVPSHAALTLANIALQLMSAMTNLFKDASEEERGEIAAHFKRMLGLYLTDVLAPKSRKSDRKR